VENTRTIRIHGQDYVPVDERVRVAHADYGGYDVLAARQYELGGRYFFEVTLRVGEHQYVGTAEIKFDGSGVDRTNPLENAETSAVGRALGFANIGNVGSIASADEVVRAKNEQAELDRQEAGEENTRTCPSCDQPMVLRSGTTRDGRPYTAWFCSAKCGQRPLWLTERKAS
jgi:hypothetical protein